LAERMEAGAGGALDEEEISSQEEETEEESRSAAARRSGGGRFGGPGRPRLHGKGAAPRILSLFGGRPAPAAHPPAEGKGGKTGTETPGGVCQGAFPTDGSGPVGIPLASLLTPE